MGLLDGFKGWLASNQVQARSSAPFTVSYEYPNLQTQLSTLTGWRRGHRGLPSIEDALGVPALLRCVTLISNTAGQLTVQGYRDGSPLDDAPRLVTRPDPWRTPRDFYRDSTWNMATRGEVVWYIASRDGDGLATALVVVPLRELTIEENTRDRMRPVYTWGNGTDADRVDALDAGQPGRAVRPRHLPAGTGRPARAWPPTARAGRHLGVGRGAAVGRQLLRQGRLSVGHAPLRGRARGRRRAVAQDAVDDRPRRTCRWSRRAA